MHDVTIDKPYFRWLFGGFGFQHSEANFTALMPDAFRDQRVLKTFAELSPTFGRVYAGFADQSREQEDRFADYYDRTFRKAGTTLYAVPCAMPALAETLDPVEYAEKVAGNLEYLVKERGCRKIRYYCLTNELMNGGRGGWFARNPEVFKRFNAALFQAFRKHGLDIPLLASDEPCTWMDRGKVLTLLDWIKDNMDDYVGAYGTHWYVSGRNPSDPGLWEEYNAYFACLVHRTLSCGGKRYILGEYGFKPARTPRDVMIQDVNFPISQPATEEESVLAKCEIGLAAMNQGAYACVDWSFVDYPDPFVAEDGDTPEERAAYEAAKCGFRMDAKYNKFGVFRWGSTDRDYRAYAELYAMGWLVKLFRKNATVLQCSFADPLLRGGAVLNPDLSFSAALVNRGPAKTATVDCSSWKTRVDGAPSLDKPLRRYVYEVGSVPYSPFGDLQGPSGTVDAKDGAFSVDLPAKSIVFLTTDYEDRQPTAVKDVRLDGGVLRWTASEAPDHRYFRVFHKGHQIASTVAEHLDVACQCGDDARVVARRRGAVATSAPDFRVVAVDRWGNEGRSCRKS